MTALAKTLEKISAHQLRALHSLFHRFAPSLSVLHPEVEEQRPLREASSGGRGDDVLLLHLSSPTFESAREQRLAWASGVLGREVASFSALIAREARNAAERGNKVLQKQWQEGRGNFA